MTSVANMRSWTGSDGKSRRRMPPATMTRPMTMKGAHAAVRSGRAPTGSSGPGVNRCRITAMHPARMTGEIGTMDRSRMSGGTAAPGSAAKSAMMTGVG